MSRGRTSVAVLCVALVVFAAFMPSGLPNVVWAPLIALWLIVPDADVTGIVCTASRSDERSASLVSHELLRAPPTARHLL